MAAQLALSLQHLHNSFLSYEIQLCKLSNSSPNGMFKYRADKLLHRKPFHVSPNAQSPIHGREYRASCSLTKSVDVECCENGSCYSVSNKIAIVWFKRDLRIDDHPGLVAASSYQSAFPVYIVEPEVLACWSIPLLEALVEALKDLRNALQGIGSDLIIRKGNIKDELLKLAHEVGATDLITEQDVEYQWNDCFQRLLHEEDHRMLLNVKLWRAPLFEVELRDLPLSYTEFQKKHYPVTLPLEAPVSLPALPDVVDRGTIPTVADLDKDTKKSLTMRCYEAAFKSLQKDSAKTILGRRIDQTDIERDYESRSPLRRILSWRNSYMSASYYRTLEKSTKDFLVSSDEVEIPNNHRTGASIAMDALYWYLRLLEQSSENPWKQLCEQVLKAETKRGASFRSIFGAALALGSLSHRRVYFEALEYDKGRCGGRVSPFGYSSFTVKAAVMDIQSMEWYQLLAIMSLEESTRKEWSVRYWRWRNFLVQFNTLGSEGPPIVFIHGFGAFGEHYRENITGLAAKGYCTWALTLLGFGRSEKPNIVYTELLWAELIRDFILEVVREPVILAGNSIGGYMVSCVAGLWPSLVKSLVLINTAGAVVPDYPSLKYVMPREKSGFAWAGSRLILSCLRITCYNLLKRCYPKRPWRVDEWLFSEIMRASHDPGAVAVLESLFYLNRPLPINFFVDRYSDKVLVVQGVNDPLSRATNRARALESNCRNVVVKLMDAGHCPHDEVADEFNTILLEWLQHLGLMKNQRDESGVTEKATVY